MVMSARRIRHHGRSFSVCAVVVAFFPDQKFDACIESVLPQVDLLVVVDNTPEVAHSYHLNKLAEGERRIHLIRNSVNVGLAAGLNQGLEFASRMGCEWILTLDQDTLCGADMVDTLIDVHKACKQGTAVVGSNYLDPRNGRLEAPVDGVNEYLERVTVITSGSLADTEVAREIGGFRGDYFIDQVDHEFCLRVRAHGYRVVISSKPIMTHSVGSPGGIRLPLLGVLPNHSPLRKYYITRNTVVTISEYWRREPMWCLRRTVRLFLGLLLMATLEKHRVAKIGAFVTGFMDGVRRRMGPCRQVWLYREW